MGWSRMPIRGIANEYNDEAKQIDAQILELFRQRKAVAGGKGLSPEMETIEQWAVEFGLEVAEITFILSNLNEARPRRHFWDGSGPLNGVLPIMKTTLEGDVEYTLTHAMQYERYSIVTLEIKYLKETVSPVNIQPELTLAVHGGTDYEIKEHGARGGGSHLQMQFMVSPPLPQDLSTISLSLVPGSNRFIRPVRVEVILDKKVDFR
ncbi:chorismate mutase family protein [Paenibacillus sp. BAC0078]